jgi:hypothetical protein
MPYAISGKSGKIEYVEMHYGKHIRKRFYTLIPENNNLATLYYKNIKTKTIRGENLSEAWSLKQRLLIYFLRCPHCERGLY